MSGPVCSPIFTIKTSVKTSMKTPRPSCDLLHEIAEGLRFSKAQLLQRTAKQKLHVVFTLLS